MDPLTHAAVGLTIAVLSGEPLSVSNPAVIACVAGAIIPDGDIVMQLKGDYAYLKNHRGMSHSIPMMFVYSGVITGLLWLIFGGISLWNVFPLALLGCFSHIALDVTNSYGAQVLWPLSKKHITFDLLLVYDPMLIILCLINTLPYTKGIFPSYMTIPIFIGYLFLRRIMKKIAQNIAYENLSYKYKTVYFRIMPSMIGLIKWHFVLYTGKRKIIGEVNMFPRRFRIIDNKKDIDMDLYNIAMDTPIAMFFEKFTPIFHVECEKKEDNYEFEFIDLRYHVSKDFLHHATAVINGDLEVVTSLFHPYTKTRNVQV
ncbi:MAG: metal-dependent hydrolase [Clostridiaceae bacterium]|nr:metal-dependent hydrolase [Clostridiaceae bacterium]